MALNITKMLEYRIGDHVLNMPYSFCPVHAPRLAIEQTKLVGLNVNAACTDAIVAEKQSRSP